jgi:hypothetical protein
VAVSSAGADAFGVTVTDADSPSDSTAYVVLRDPTGRVGTAQPVPNAQQVLGLAFAAGGLELLTANSKQGDACCGSAGVVRLGAGGHFSRARMLVGRLAGATEGQLVPVSGRLVAAIATERGVWSAQSSRGAQFGRVHRLTSGDARPETFSAAGLAAGSAIVAWAQRDKRNPDPRTIYTAAGTARGAPSQRHPAVTVVASHRVDEVAIAGAGGPTIAWIESWFDSRGGYHSQVELADLSHPRQTRAFPVSGQIASDLVFASDGKGDQLLAWKTCTRAGSCSVREVVRRTGTRFAGPARLGGVEPAEAPSAALTPSGAGVVGWIARGEVLASEVRAGAVRFGAARIISDAGDASGLALQGGPASTALAAWSQGVLAPHVVGAAYRAG